MGLQVDLSGSDPGINAGAKGKKDRERSWQGQAAKGHAEARGRALWAVSSTLPRPLTATAALRPEREVSFVGAWERGGTASR
jgi:hypothetical protein